MINTNKPFQMYGLYTKEEILDQFTIIDEKAHKLLAHFKNEPNTYYVFLFKNHLNRWVHVSKYPKNQHDKTPIENRNYHVL